ncbi:MAG: hypothetical protein U9Q27_02410 [Patescibacteria group bacterium]|nr:hypothetical protein [Patescibacteria group bacterium]
MKTIAELIDWDIVEKNIKDIESALDSYNRTDLNLNYDKFLMFSMISAIRESLFNISNLIRTTGSIESEMLEDKCNIREIAQNEQVCEAYCVIFRYERVFSLYICEKHGYLENVFLYYNALDNIKDFGIKCEYYEILNYFSEIDQEDNFKRIVSIMNKSESN